MLGLTSFEQDELEPWSSEEVLIAAESWWRLSVLEVCSVVAGCLER